MTLILARGRLDLVHLVGKKSKINDDEEEDLRSEDTTPEPSGSHDGDDSDGVGGNDYIDGSDGGGGSAWPLGFTGESQFTHTTQDTDHGAHDPSRARRSSQHHSNPQDLC